MAVDLTKVVLHSDYPAFINNRVYEGTITVTGTTSEGINTYTFDIALDQEPDLVDIMFEGVEANIGRPAGAYFKEGFATIETDGVDMTGWLSSEIDGTTLTITVTVPQTFSGTQNIIDTDLGYRMVDYSTTTNKGFDSRFNYLKRIYTDTEPITLPAAGTQETFTFDHNLGYVPFYVVGAELTDTSTIWSNNYVFEGTAYGSAGAVTPPQLRYWCDDTTLTIKIANGLNGGQQSGVRDVYWAIYRDYDE